MPNPMTGTEEAPTKTPRQQNDDVLTKCGIVTPDEAEQIAKRYNASHFSNYRDMGEKARYSIPADPRRDDDLRLAAFIEQARRTRALVRELRDLTATAAMSTEYRLRLDAEMAALGLDDSTKGGG